MTNVVAGFDVAAPTGVVASSGNVAGGQLGSGNYMYVVTFASVDGQTVASPASAPASTTSGSMTVNLPISAGYVVARNVYRTTSGGSTYYFLAKVPDNTTAQYVDVLPDTQLGQAYTLQSTPADSEEKISGFLALDKPLVMSTSLVSTVSGTKLQLQSERNYVVTANLGDSVMLPPAYSANVGTTVVVFNLSGTIVNVYPFSGQVLSAVYPLSSVADVPIKLFPGAKYEFSLLAANTWFTLTGAPVGSGSGPLIFNTVTGYTAGPTNGVMSYQRMGTTVTCWFSYNATPASTNNSLMIQVPVLRSNFVATTDVVDGFLINQASPPAVVGYMFAIVGSQQIYVAHNAAAITPAGYSGYFNYNLV